MLNVSSPESEIVASHDQASASLSSLIESPEDLIWSIDLNFGLVTFNRSLKQHIERNFGAQAAIGKRPEDLLPPERAAIWPPLFQRALAQGPFQAEISFPHGRILEISFNPIVVDGRTTGLTMVGKDVTESHRTEMGLRESADFFEEAQRFGALGCYVLDIPSGQWTGSDTLDELFGIDKDCEHTIESWLALVHPEDLPMMLEHLTCEVIEKGGTFDKEYRIVRRRDQVERWVHGLGRLDLDFQGQPLKLRGVIKDITEHKRAEMQLLESEERYRATFEQAPLGIAHTSSDGHFLRCNARFAEIIGYPQDEVPGLSFQQITDPEDVPVSLDIREKILKADRDRFCWEKRYLRKDGSRVRIRITVSAQRDGQGRIVHHIALVEDIDALKAAEERYRTVFETSLDAVLISRIDDGRYVDFNQAFLDMIGYERDEATGRTSLELNVWADPLDRHRLAEMISKNASCRSLQIKLRRKSGEFFWGEISASPIEIDGIPCILSMTRDISEAKAAQHRLTASAEALRVSEERYRKAFQTSLDSITISRADDGRYIEVNQAFLDLTGFERDEVIGRTSLEINLWSDPRDRENLDEIVARTKQFRNVEIQFRKKGGEPIWGLVSASIIEIDGVRCVLAIARDISDAKAAEDQIYNLAFFDPLTGLPNRRLLLERLHQTLVSTNKTGRMRALLLVDLDNFKTLNDTLGHQTGDMLLQETASRLAVCARDADTVGRLGGDEFVLMLENLSEIPEDAAAQAKDIGEKILATVAQPYLLDGRECRSSASIGISVFGDRRESSNEVLQQADIAMDQAKAGGRNTMRFFAPALQAGVNARAAMEQELREALETGQFVLYYQPQIDRNRLVGAEALIRWNHPRRNILAPGEFIPLAEETGLILPLGKWVLESACQQIAAWANRRQSARLSVAVNISARQFRQPDFVQQVLTALDRTGANPRNLGLELTESMLIENIEEVIDKMKELKSHGLKFSLDDFGTGYSSLAYLKRLPLNQLKIDRSFIRDMLSDEGSAAIAQTIISLSRAMGLPVMAEGVETDEQREFLTRIGCHAFQGFLFSRPLPLDEFEFQWLPCGRSSASIAN